MCLFSVNAQIDRLGETCTKGIWYWSLYLQRLGTCHEEEHGQEMGWISWLRVDVEEKEEEEEPVNTEGGLEVWPWMLAQ